MRERINKLVDKAYSIHEELEKIERELRRHLIDKGKLPEGQALCHLGPARLKHLPGQTARTPGDGPYNAMSRPASSNKTSRKHENGCASRREFRTC